MRTNDSVCYGCPRRAAACHAACPDGLAEEAVNRRRRAETVKRRAGFYGVHDSRRVNLADRERTRKDHWNY